MFSALTPSDSIFCSEAYVHTVHHTLQRDLQGKTNVRAIALIRSFAIIRRQLGQPMRFVLQMTNKCGTDTNQRGAVKNSIECDIDTNHRCAARQSPMRRKTITALRYRFCKSRALWPICRFVTSQVFITPIDRA